MEQQLDATYLRPDLLSRCVALSIVAISIGLAILCICWGISLFWRSTTVEDRNMPLALAPVKTPEGVTVKAVEPAASPQPIQQEVVVFSTVRHGSGSVVTGWKFPNGSSRVPTDQYCYYHASNGDKSSTKIDIAANGRPSDWDLRSKVPEIEEAQRKCQWWRS